MLIKFSNDSSVLPVRRFELKKQEHLNTKKIHKQNELKREESTDKG